MASSTLGFDKHAGAGASSKSVAPSRADLTFGSTAICVFVAKFYGSMPFLLQGAHSLSEIKFSDFSLTFP